MKRTVRLIAALLSCAAVLPFSGCNESAGSHGTDIRSSAPEELTVPESTADDTTAADNTAAAITEEETRKVKTKTYKPLNYADMKAMWLSQFDLNEVYCQGGSQRSESSYRTLIRNILEYDKEIGINTVIVQVRPNADSMYPSDVYPASYYVVGSYGKSHVYDPFAILIDEAHALGLSVQAWINPLRCMTASQITSVNRKYKIREWYDDKDKNGTYVVKNGNNYYLNPAYEEVRALITDGASEILAGYDVDGLHMDDYFYPTTDASFDLSAYTQYKKDGGRLTLENWRRDNLNRLVSELYSEVKEYGADIQFGISPAGNINTVYNSQYADVYT